MDKPRYRYNWKTGVAEPIIFFKLRISSEEYKQAQRKKNLMLNIMAERLSTGIPYPIEDENIH